MTSPSSGSRRALLERMVLAIGLVVAQRLAPAAAAGEEIKEADKIGKQDAKYQNHRNGQQRCEICLQFEPPHACKIVQGPIDPQGWCQYFAARENAR